MALTLTRLNNVLTPTDHCTTKLSPGPVRARCQAHRARAIRVITTFWDNVVTTCGLVKGLSAIDVLARCRRRGLNDIVFNALVDLYAANWMLRRVEDSIDGTIDYEIE